MNFHFQTKHEGSVMSQGLLDALSPLEGEIQRLEQTKGLKNATD